MKRAAWVIAFGGLVLGASARADERIGPEILIDQPSYIWGAPRVVSDGVGALVVWGAAYSPYTVYSAHIDGAGQVSGPFVVSAGPELKRQLEVASDGRTTLVVWSDYSSQKVSGVKAVRLDPSGAPIDSTPITLETRNVGSYGSLSDVDVAFDGAMFRVIWLRNSGHNKVYTRRVGIDGGTFARSRTVRARNMARVPFEPKIGCRRAGECLLTWLQTAGLDAVEGVLVRGDTIVNREVIRFLEDARSYQISSDGTNYVIVGTRFDIGSCATGCAQDAVAGRVSAAGEPLDGAGFRVNNRPPTGSPFVVDVGLAFDGNDYAVTFLDFTPSCGFNLYAARIRPDGTVVNPDIPGSPLVEGSSAGSAAVAATRTEGVVAWQDLRPSLCGNFSYYQSIYAQRALAHADASGAPLVEIGAIGARSVPEQGVLRLTLAASGLNPASAVFSATNLPPGAVFDPATRAFQWKPNPDEAGTYPGVHFEAADGVQTVSEDVTITVTEGSLAMCGTVERMGMPVANVAVQVKGKHGKPRTVVSDANGRFCFFYMIQDVYRLTVGKPSRREWDAEPLTVLMTGADDTAVQFVVRRIG